MRLLGIRDVLTGDEVDAFHRGALRIIDRVGMQIENDEMLDVLADFGGRVDKSTQRVTFAPQFVEDFLESRERIEVGSPPDKLRLEAGVGGYSLNYEDPETGDVRLFTTDDLVNSVRLADSLPHMKYVGPVGIPQDIPQIMAPLTVRYHLWRHTEKTLGNSYMIWDQKLCPYVWDMCTILSEMEGRPMTDVLRPTNFMVSPLRFASEEAAQFVWFWKKGHYFNVTHMHSAGGSAPVTLPGTIVLWLAESIILNMMAAAFYGRKYMYMGCSLSPMDMRRGTYPYGRPEETLMEIAAGQLIRHYGGGAGGGAGGGSNSKSMDYEAGINNACGPALGIAFNGSVGMQMGLYSVDEVFSPIKLVIDCEFLDHMLRLARPVEVNGDTLALDVIEEVGPGGVFTDRMHTAEHFRDELWMPKLYSWENYESWKASGRLDIRDRAREVVRKAHAEHHPQGIKAETEEAILQFLGRAERDLVA